MRKMISVVTICFLAMMTFSGCSILQKLGLESSENDELHPASSIVMGEEEAKKLTDKVPIHLYFANEDNTKLTLEVRYIAVAEAKKSTSNLASVIVKELIAGPSKDGGLKGTIPAGTALKNPVSVSSGVATVDLSKEFVSKHPGGKEAAQVTIYSIVNSLTELKDVEKVKFTIDGKAQEDFKGVFKFNTAFPRSTALISKDVSKPGTAGAADTKDTDGKKKVTPAPTPAAKSKDGVNKTNAPAQDGNQDVEISGDADSSNNVGVSGDSEPSEDLGVSGDAGSSDGLEEILE